MCTLETDRLLLRRFRAEDWADLFEYLSREDVVRFEPYGVFTAEACRQEAQGRAGNAAFWSVCLKDGGKLIGNVYFQQQEPARLLTWELGYVFNPAFYGRGYATEACRGIMDYGFRRLDAHRIMAMCNPQNVSSWRLLDRLHMRREGHLHRNVFFKLDDHGDPRWVDTYIYALLSSEWLELNGQG